jgi:exodeoxyribonuclease V beta subunit
MIIFDPISTPLEGTNLIEASAGTGKTYTITGLFLRLILEKQLTVNQILVVTFTKAATEELKERIRKKLSEAKSAFLKGSSDDTFIDSLIRKSDHPAAAIQSIHNALINFDDAAIFTIHGFCRRILNENAFETRSLFDTELVSDPADINREIVEDFWRKYIYNLPMECISYILKNISGPEYYLKLAWQKRSANTKIIPELEKPELKSLDGFRVSFEKLKRIWPDSRLDILELLKDPSLNGRIYGSYKTQTHQKGISKRDLIIGSIGEAMDRFVDEKSVGFPLFKDFEKLTATKIKTATRKNHSPPPHEIFEICDLLFDQSSILKAEIEAYMLYLKTMFFRFADRQLSTAKKQRNILLYDDLLTTVKDALESDKGNILAETLRNKYGAGLVDEFQDTDTVQYEIFSRIFHSKKSMLFMIGDPKQSIYGFRGADIFSYMKAAQNADSKFTLIKNWRSDSGLITAVNTLFSNTKSPFIFDRIGFEAGVSGKQPEPDGSRFSPAFILWYLEGNKNTDTSQPLSKTESVQRIVKAVANEISSLVSSNPKAPSANPTGFRGDGAAPNDIAVLVRTNRQAQLIKNALTLKNVPSVLHNTGNIFHTHEAVEMERVLMAVAEPGNERIYRAALVTDIIGVSAIEIDSDGDTSLALEEKRGRFRKYSGLWTRYGFIRMFRMLLSEEHVREQMLKFPDGERRLTNILHLAEILHQESHDKKLKMTGLLKWLSAQINTDMLLSETHQLRLESDDLAVKIITIHKSKGLEFPIVFCPFVWDGALIKDSEILFHDIDDNETPTLDLGSNAFDNHLVSAQNEKLSENLRLLYVALTRAVNRCYLVWGRFNTAETSALAYLLHYRETVDHIIDKENPVLSLKTEFSEKNDADFFEDLKCIEKKSKNTIKICPLPAEDISTYSIKEDSKAPLSCRRFSGNIDTSWKISSFSHLISRTPEDEEAPDRDAIQDYLTSPSDNDLDLNERADIFSFPKGTRAGLFFHDILEHLDFAADTPEQKRALVLEKLHAYGFESKWKQPVCSMIDHVISLPLCIDNITIKLSSIQFEHKINEMEFYFPLKPLSPYELKKIFLDYGNIDLLGDFPDRIGKLSFSVIRGFMKGFIDMVFYDQGRFWLVDWKSNYLGKNIEDYGKDALSSTMQKNFYILQYHLYVLALVQYLQQRMPGFSYEKHFGGVFYIFLRGVDPEKKSEYGIYTDLPDKDLVEALGRALLAKN